MTMATTATKRRILFVDDEQNVLDGLRNLLRKQRHVWDMSFALGGQAALDQMERGEVDVIVSDMRMPGMDGSELLTRVKAQYPQTARIVLSGHAERDAIARVIRVAHQFLSKPADANTVRTVIERTCEYLTLMRDEGIRRVVGSMVKLPSLPETYWQLTRMAEDPDAGINDMARVVETDPGMSVKVLQLVNSSYFGLAQRTESIVKAVSYLGIENLKGLLVAAHVFGADAPAVAGLSLTQMRDEAVLAANLARQIVKSPKYADAAFSAAIVRDVGMLILASDPSKRYPEILRRARENKERLHVVEKAELGVTHGAVGAYLLGVWGVPFVLAETVAYHDSPGTVTEGDREVLAAVHIADGLVASAATGADPIAGGTLDASFLEHMGLLNDVPKWQAKAAELIARQAN
jgi:HD-like signal output (HDOD) protein/ActR/RegA family two-component response regulator